MIGVRQLFLLISIAVGNIQPATAKTNIQPSEQSSWECHLLSLGVKLPDALKPALEALDHSLTHTTENTARGNFLTGIVPQTLVDQLAAVIEEHEVQKLGTPSDGMTKTKRLAQQIIQRRKNGEIKDATLVELMRSGATEGNALLRVYLDLMDESEKTLVRFLDAQDQGYIRHSDYLDVLAALIFLRDPSGALTVIPNGQFSHILDLAKELPETRDIVVFQQNLEYLASAVLTKSFILPKPFTSSDHQTLRAGAVIPTFDRNFSLYDDNQTIGLPIEYVPLNPHAPETLYHDFHNRMQRFGQSLMALKIKVDSNRYYSMSDLLSPYVKIMNAYQTVRAKLPSREQLVLDLAFASARFQVIGFTLIGVDEIKSKLLRIGVKSDGELNEFSQLYLQTPEAKAHIKNELDGDLNEYIFVDVATKLIAAIK